MRQYIVALCILLFVGLVAFCVLTLPSGLTAGHIPKHTPDPENGEVMFHAGGCASCHATPASKKCDTPKSEDKMRLGGGRCLKTPFGTFMVPNISPDLETGIGGWSDLEFVNAMLRGVSPAGKHYYPSFPYTSYQRMKVTDVLDLKAYLDSLPAVKKYSRRHKLWPPLRIRRGLGLWKLAYLDGKVFVPDPQKSDVHNRGAYLVNGPGHCAECHSPRDLFGGIDRSRAFSGGPSPEGKGSVPNITPHATGLADWSDQDIAEALKTGFTPSFDTFGGLMLAVQDNMSKLSDADRAAIGVYLKSLKPMRSSTKKYRR